MSLLASVSILCAVAAFLATAFAAAVAAALGFAKWVIDFWPSWAMWSALAVMLFTLLLDALASLCALAWLAHRLVPGQW